VCAHLAMDAEDLMKRSLQRRIVAEQCCPGGIHTCLDMCRNGNGQSLPNPAEREDTTCLILASDKLLYTSRPVRVCVAGR
jgi:hypothetical protein